MLLRLLQQYARTSSVHPFRNLHTDCSSLRCDCPFFDAVSSCMPCPMSVADIISRGFPVPHITWSLLFVFVQIADSSIFLIMLTNFFKALQPLLYRSECLCFLLSHSAENTRDKQFSSQTFICLSLSLASFRYSLNLLLICLVCRQKSLPS